MDLCARWYGAHPSTPFYCKFDYGLSSQQAQSDISGSNNLVNTFRDAIDQLFSAYSKQPAHRRAKVLSEKY